MTTPSTWFITGTSTGFGRAMTEKLLARGDRVAATLREPQRLAELQAHYGARLWVAALDVTDAQAVRQTVERAFHDLGRIDVIVNNAGYGLFGAAEEFSDAQIGHQLATNVLGSMQVIRAALPHFRAQGGGRFIQVSSEGGQVTYPVFSLYHASKWVIEGFVESVAQEVAGFGVEFTIAEPGAAKTHFLSGLIQPATTMKVYDDSLVGHVRRMVLGGELKDFGALGDPDKMAQAMIDSADIHPAPRRLVMGSTSYAHIGDTLLRRLAELEAQQDIALATDADDVPDSFSA